MGYVTSNLMPNETVITFGKLHWWIYVPGLFWLICASVLAYGAYQYRDSPDLAPMLLLLARVACVITLLRAAWKLLWAWLLRFSTEVALTNRRVIVKWGLFKRKTVELLHSKVESIQVEQSILGRILSFGSLSVNGVGASSAPVLYIAAPMRFRRRALEIIDNN